MVRSHLICFAVSAAMMAVLPSMAAAQVSDDVVKIGVLSDMGGTYAAASGRGTVTAIQMAIEDFGGKVLGKPIEVLVGDHQNKADLGATIARKWIEVEKVDAIADIPGSNVALAVQNLTREKKVAMLVGGAGSTELIGKSCSPTTVQYVFDTYSLAKSSAKAAVDKLGKTFFFITLDSAFGTAIEGALTAARSSALSSILSASWTFRPSFYRLRPRRRPSSCWRTGQAMRPMH
jgi:branched-chain amino acid transport system substrate-binding protein